MLVACDALSRGSDLTRVLLAVAGLQLWGLYFCSILSVAVFFLVAVYFMFIAGYIKVRATTTRA